MYRVGLDLGSSYTKGVLVNERNEIIECMAVKTGHNFSTAYKKIMEVFSQGRQIELPVHSCGYGRECLDIEFVAHSEIIVLAKAVFELYQQKATILDIGGQDTKCIYLKDDGTIDNFKMNRKCAAGTGSFLEEIAYRLDVPAENFHDLAKQATEKIKLNSFCTVFAISETIGMIKAGISLPNIVLSVYNSIVDRAMEMVQPEGKLILTGGIPQKHPLLVQLFQQRWPDVESPPHAQFLASYGTLL